MNNKLYRLGIIWVSLILSLFLYQFYVDLASPQVPYMDSIRFLVQIDQILKGEISWLEVYGAGEHRGLIYPIITLAEWVFWGVDARITTILTGFVVVATFFYWLSAFLSPQAGVIFEGKRVTAKILIVCFISAAIIVSPAGFELWTLDLGFAQLFKNFLIVTFLYFLAIKRCWAKTSIHAIVFGAYGGFLILFATYGWSYPFLIASFFALLCSALRTPEIRMQAAVVIILMFLAQAIYIYSGYGVFAGDKSSVAGGLSIIGLIKGILYGAATVFIGNESMEKVSLPVVISMLLGAFSLILAAIALLIALVEQTREKIFLSSLLVFSLAVLAGVAVARGSVLFTNVGASRYFVDYIWLLLAPVAIVFTAQSSILTRYIPSWFIACMPLKKILLLSKMLTLLLFTAAILGHLITWGIELKTAPYRAVMFKNMAGIYYRGVSSEADASLLQSVFPVAKKAISVAQLYNLSVLRHDVARCGLHAAEYLDGWYLPGNNQYRWMRKQGSIVLDSCVAQVTIKGYLPEHFNARELTVDYRATRQIISLVPGNEFSFALSLSDTKNNVIHFQLDKTTIPANVRINTDTRELGLLLTYIGE